jgi:hypothetical protein
MPRRQRVIFLENSGTMKNLPRAKSLLGFVTLAAFACFGLLAEGCAITMNMPASRFESPETRGKLLKVQLDGGLQGSHTVVVVNDITANPVQVNSPGFDRSNASFRGAFGLGIFRDLDLSLKLAWNSPTLFQVKYQILGKPELETQVGNIALAVTAAIGTLQGTGSAAGVLNNLAAKYDLTATTYDLALIAGYRFHETFMVYGGPFVTSTSFSGHVDQTTTSVSTFPFSGTAGQAGLNVGIQWDSTVVYAKLEEAWSAAHAGSATQSGFFTGGTFGIRF